MRRTSVAFMSAAAAMNAAAGAGSTLWCCVTPERERKTRRMMEALAAGCDGRVVVGDPPPGNDPFIVWGQEWLTLRIVPHAIRTGRPFFHLDNGYFLPAQGSTCGYYRMTFCGMSPKYLRDAPAPRSLDLRPTMAPWRETGTHILLAMPGATFGRAAGVNVPLWIEGIGERLRAATGRPIVVRPKGEGVHLGRQLKDCWALVTHSSNVAVDAVLAGIPVFVEPTSPAVPVGRVDWGPGDIEYPETPNREQWWASLMAQQFTIDEMAHGWCRSFMFRCLSSHAVLAQSQSVLGRGQ